MKKKNHKETETEPASGEKKNFPPMLRNAIFVFVIVSVGFVAYSNSFEVPFYVDDNAYIRDNPLIKDSRYFLSPGDTALQPLQQSVRLHYKTRYLGFLTFFLNYKLFGLDLTALHAVNLAMHIANALMVYLLAMLTFRSPALSASRLREHTTWIALASALLFVSHPLQIQAVTYLSQRFTLLVAFFYLSTATLYAHYRLTGRRASYILSIVCAVLAMMSKENAFTLPVALGFYEFVFFKDTLRKSAVRLAPLFLTMVIVPLGHIDPSAPMSDFLSDATNVSHDMPRHHYLFTQFPVIVKYIRLIFLPVGLNFFHHAPLHETLWDARVFLSLLFLLAIVASAGFLYRRSWAGEPALRVVGFGVLWFFLAISVESSVIVLVNFIFEHRVYLPSAGLFIGLTTMIFLLADKMSPARALKISVVFLTCVTAVLVAGTLSRNAKWQDPYVFFEDSVRKAPGSHMAHNNLGHEYSSRGMTEEAIEQFNIAISLEPKNIAAIENLARLYINQKRYDEAIAQFESLLDIVPDNPSTLTYIGNVLLAMGDIDGAIEYYRKVVKISKDNFLAHYNLGRALEKSGDAEGAKEGYAMAIEKKPDFPNAHYDLANLHASRGEMSDAIEHYRRTIEILPEFGNSYINLGNVYAFQGDTEKAIEQFKAALEVNPASIEALNNLGNAYMEKGSVEQAIEHYRKVKELQPEFPDIHYNLGNAYLSKGSLDAAIEQYEMAIDINPVDPRAHNNLGVAYYKKGMNDKAREHFSKADMFMQQGQ